MHTSAKNRRYRFTAVAVLLGWLFSIAVSSAYGCTLWETEHHGGHESQSSTTHGVVHDLHQQALADDASGADADVCKAACDLQASPVVKAASGNAPDLNFVALYTSLYVLALAPPAPREADKPHNTGLPYAHSQSLRSTRLTL